ncbi:helix-hairpin-helix domain-containing protein [Chelonobacter oris]|uniref:helix-hairpin-helix domain-containing protein n=1 Tax=Chelonobacter oris TaxID=505317 RepID=UPI001269AA37|nr:helix-hairpin-helix domain-containing protein [Chelonobacter oris]
MPFSEQEKAQLRRLKYVGDTVINRLEQIGIHSFEQLAKERYEDICTRIAALLGSNC